MFPNHSTAGKAAFSAGLSTMAAAIALLALSPTVYAGPTGGTVTAGTATINQSGSVTNIDQSTNKAIINWQSFSIAKQETVNFNQPSASSATLNRVTGNERSVISGALNANGQVFIVNSAGVLFSKGAQVNVGGLVASTKDIADQDFLAGNYTFSGDSKAAVVNRGHIKAAPGGYVALLGHTVANDGVIVAKLGTVAMAAGDKMTLNFGGDSLVDVTIDQGTLNALVENKRAIIADGGQVIMTAKAADEVVAAQVNNTGIVQAQTVAALTGGGNPTVAIGSITLEADGGNVNAGGKLDVSSPKGGNAGTIKVLAKGGTATVTGKLNASAPVSGNGGSIETSGDHVHVADSASITTKAANGQTGTWTLDPDGFTVAASGGDITGTALSSELASNNVTILSTSGSGADGNININVAVNWSANTLTLTATNNVYVNAVMTATGTAGFTANYGTGTNADGSPNGLYMAQGTTNGAPNGSFVGRLDFSNTTPSALKIGGHTYTVVTDLAQLVSLTTADFNANGVVTGFYALGANLSGTTANGYAAAGPNGANTVANQTSTNISNSSAPLVPEMSGALDGLGHTVNNVAIFDPVHGNFASGEDGLVGQADTGSLIRNVGITNMNVNSGGNANKGGADVGTLAGEVFGGTVSNTFVSGATISASEDVGGLIGSAIGGSITNSNAINVAVAGFSNVGGFIGANFANGATGLGGIITNSTATGTVTATNGATTSARSDFGGFVGLNDGGAISNSSANVTVSFDQTNANERVFFNNGINLGDLNNIGGFVGQNEFITINLSGVGANTVRTGVGGTITNSIAYGNVSAPGTNTGGFVGSNSGGTITNSAAHGTVTDNSTLRVGNSGNVGGFAGQSAGGTVISRGATVPVAGSGTISNSSANGIVNGGNGEGIGGFVGTNGGPITGSIANAGASNPNVVTVSGQDGVGGFAGNNSGSITNSQSINSVQGTFNVGGLVGTNGTGSTTVATIDSSTALGDVNGTNLANASNTGTGGFVGRNQGAISNSVFLGGNVTGGQNVGGFVGLNASASNGGNAVAGTIINSATHAFSVHGVLNVGAFAGANGTPGVGSLTNCNACFQNDLVFDPQPGLLDVGFGSFNGVSDFFTPTPPPPSNTPSNQPGPSDQPDDNSLASQAGQLGSQLGDGANTFYENTSQDFSSDGQNGGGTNLLANILSNISPGAGGNGSDNGDNGNYGADVQGVDINGQHFDTQGNGDGSGDQADGDDKKKNH